MISFCFNNIHVLPFIITVLIGLVFCKAFFMSHQLGFSYDDAKITNDSLYEHLSFYL